MKSILIIGMGRFGHHLAINFLEHGNDVMIIDQDEKKVADLVPYCKGLPEVRQLCYFHYY